MILAVEVSVNQGTRRRRRRSIMSVQAVYPVPDNFITVIKNVFFCRTQKVTSEDIAAGKHKLILSSSLILSLILLSVWRNIQW